MVFFTFRPHSLRKTLTVLKASSPARATPAKALKAAQGASSHLCLILAAHSAMAFTFTSTSPSASAAAAARG